MENNIRFPGEWEEHEATWINWPVNPDNWPGKMETVAWAFCEMIRHIAEGETVHVTLPDEATVAIARQMLADSGCNMKNVQTHLAPSDYGWMRDCGPQFIEKNNKPAIMDFHFNGWARYEDWQQDNALPNLASKVTSTELIDPQINGRTFVLEGGAVDSNGNGTILTTRECLLHETEQVRNPGMTQEENEKALNDFLGAEHVIWLNRGTVGDDTHGHVDDIARFVNDNTIVACTEIDSGDANYESLKENWDILQEAVLQDGTKPRLIELPMPKPLYHKGQRLPASYANFYICNAAVLVPTFNDLSDRIALWILSDLFADRPVIGIHALDLVLGLGSVHCLTRQQPALRT